MAKYDREIFRVSKDAGRAKDLIESAKENEKIITVIPKSAPYKILTEHYETIIQLATALMYSEGFKTLSHTGLIKFLRRYPSLSGDDIRIIDQIRKFRHGIVYYGRREGGNFYTNHKKEIEKLVKKLFILANKKTTENTG